MNKELNFKIRKIGSTFTPPVLNFQNKMLELAKELERQLSNLLWPCPSCGRGPAKTEFCHVRINVRHYASSCSFCDHRWTRAVEFDGVAIKHKLVASLREEPTTASVDKEQPE